MNRRPLFVLSAVIFCAAGYGGDKNWKGGEGLNWSNPANWAELSVPVDGDAVFISGDSVNDIPDLSLSSLTVAGSDARVIQPSGSLKVGRLNIGSKDHGGSVKLENSILTGTVFFGGEDGSSEVNSRVDVLTIGAGAEVRGCIFHHNTRHLARVEFDGGKLVYQNNGDGNWRSLSMCWTEGDLLLVGLNGNPICFDASGNHVTFPALERNDSSGTLRMEGAGGLKFYNLPPDKNQPLHFFGDYPGKTDFSGLSGPISVMQGGLRVFTDEPFGGPKEFALGDDAYLDLNTFAMSASSITGGYVTNTHAVGISPATLKAVVSADETWDVRGDVSIEKFGSGKLTLASGPMPARVSVYEGRLSTCGHEPFVYRHYRFKIEDVRVQTEGMNGDVMQFSELKLFDGDAEVTSRRSGFSFGVDDSMYSPGEDPSKVLDGETATKWCDMSLTAVNRELHGECCWIRLDYAAPQRVTRYEWYTANDAVDRGDGLSWRDPISWRLQGSEDGEVWHDLDVVSSYATTSDRQVTAGSFQCSDDNIVRKDYGDVSSIAVGSGASLSTANGRIMHLKSFENCGTVAWGEQVDWYCGEDDGDGLLMNPQMSGSGSLIKEGVGTVKVIGANRYAGETLVRSGTLIFTGGDAVVPVADRFFRFTVRKVKRAGDPFQISELALFDKDGSRVNLGLSNRGYGVQARDLQPGQCSALRGWNWGGQSIECAFDGSLDTHWCPCYYQSYDDAGGGADNTISPDPDDENSWAVLYMRLAEDSAPVTAYDLCTGIDAPGSDGYGRDAVDFTLEASVDGVNWRVIDKRVGYDPPKTIKTWYNSGGTFSLNSSMCDADAVGAFLPESVLRISAGATLKIVGAATEVKRIAVDYSGAGVLDGFKPAEDGVLELIGFPDDALPDGYCLSLAIHNSADEIGRLSGWSVVSGGKVLPVRVGWDGRSIRLYKHGLKMLLR